MPTISHHDDDERTLIPLYFVLGSMTEKENPLNSEWETWLQRLCPVSGSTIIAFDCQLSHPRAVQLTSSSQKLRQTSRNITRRFGCKSLAVAFSFWLSLGQRQLIKETINSQLTSRLITLSLFGRSFQVNWRETRFCFYSSSRPPRNKGKNELVGAFI